MNWAQIIIASLIVLRVIAEVAHSGESKTGKYDATTGIIAAIIEVSLLNWGGFFDCWTK